MAAAFTRLLAASSPRASSAAGRTSDLRGSWRAVRTHMSTGQPADLSSLRRPELPPHRHIAISPLVKPRLRHPQRPARHRLQNTVPIPSKQRSRRSGSDRVEIFRAYPWAATRKMGCCTGGEYERTMLVSSSGALAVARGDLPTEFSDAFAGAHLVAWDIETSGLDWQQARIGTCQLFAEGVGVVVVSVDPDLVPRRLVALLEDTEVTKVFHHAPFDLRFMIHEWSARPGSVRCTKVASKLLDPKAPNEAHTLQRLVARYAGVELVKGPVRTSDWTARTLSGEQIDYAAADVIHLPALLRELEARLDRHGLAWLYERCCGFLPARAALEIGGYPDVFAY
jgi:ribonuclease D